MPASSDQETVEENPSDQAVSNQDASDQQPGEGGASGQPAENAPASAPAAPPKKDRKALTIALAVFSIVVFAGIGLVIFNATGTSAAEKAMADSLAQDPVITERVISSTWGEQRGFTATNVEVRDLDRGFLAPAAAATVSVRATNGSFELNDTFSVQCEDRGYGWAITQADMTKDIYQPAAKIPDEVLLANLPAIMTKADEVNGSLAYANPLNVADFFGVDTKAVVVSNEFDRGEEDATIALTRMVDGIAHEGELDVVMGWDAQAQPPDWTLISVTALGDTEGAMGSVVREGLPASATRADEAEMAGKDAGGGSFWVNFMTRMLGQESSPYVRIGFANIANNDTDMQFTVISNETGEMLYESPRIAPGMCLDFFTLAEPLEPGDHPVTVQYTAYGDGWRYDDTVNVDRDCNIYVTEDMHL